jgi:para-aminobenzoate synthetase
LPVTPAANTNAAHNEGLYAHWRSLPFAVDTAAAFRTLFGRAPAAFWLDSSRADNTGARWSFMGDASGPLASTVTYDAGTGELLRRDRAGLHREAGGIFAWLEHARRGMPFAPPPCPFVGGHVGWLGYELQAECGSTVRQRAQTPDAFFIHADRLIAVDHAAGQTYVIALAPPREQASANAWIESVEARLGDLSPCEPRLNPRYGAPVEFRLDRDRKTYLADIAQCLDWIGEGQTYQVCLTNHLRCTAELDPLDLYFILRRLNPAPFAAFIRWPGGAVLSASPERFLALDKEGRVETKPIKGTIRRDTDPVRDAALAKTLAASEKDRAENLMIVDLLRNDLSRVCRIGSVEVPSLMAIESFATVHQLVSTVRGQLRPECSAIDLIRAAFPGGSMTGAPKLHTLTLIDRLEGRARGIYSGALGWIGDDGAMDLNIVIRTIVMQGGQISIGAGGGIVADSQPEAEFDEMLLKARALIHAITLAATGEMGDDLYRIAGL